MCLLVLLLLLCFRILISKELLVVLGRGNQQASLDGVAHNIRESRGRCLAKRGDEANFRDEGLVVDTPKSHDDGLRNGGYRFTDCWRSRCRRHHR
jgi:hypothetical protein